MGTTTLPITPSMNQDFTCTLPVGNRNVTLDFSITYNNQGEYWFMSIKDHDSGRLLIDGLPLLPGEYPSADLLGQHKYLGIGSAYLISLSNDDTVPTFDSLGKSHLIAWSD